MNSLQLATQFIEQALKGKYITNNHIKPLIDALNNDFQTSVCGQSEQGKPIYKIVFGTGHKKVLMWSQMHGNEPTTTKGLFDFLNFLQSNDERAQKIKTTYTLICIPILNPDGAEAYTRANANLVDLNRDAVALTQVESKILRGLIEEVQPDLCFNLHDQRTIFGIEAFKLPATMSFLSPAYNEERAYNSVRFEAIHHINAINKELQQYIPNQVGRFDDSFNINCIGDYVTSIGIPTILFEAGHFQNDYNREESRKYVFISLLAALSKIESEKNSQELDEYLRIPQNSKCFFDFVYRNVKVFDKNEEKIITFAAQFEEELKEEKVHFNAKIIQIDNLDAIYGHFEFDANGMEFSSDYGKFPIKTQKADFYLNNLLKFDNGLQFL